MTLVEFGRNLTQLDAVFMPTYDEVCVSLLKDSSDISKALTIIFFIEGSSEEHWANVIFESVEFSQSLLKHYHRVLVTEVDGDRADSQMDYVGAGIIVDWKVSRGKVTNYRVFA